MKRRHFLKAAGAVALASPALVASTSNGHSTSTTPPPEISIKWLGGATMLITCGELTLLTDPAFGDGESAFLMGNPNEMFDLKKGPTVREHSRHTDFLGLDIDGVDYVLLSHMHEDHFDQTAERMIPKDMPIFLPKFDEQRIISKGFTKATVAVPTSTFTLSKGNTEVTITPIPADHSENEQIAAILGQGNGYWMVFGRNGWSKSIYWTGDTFLTPKVQKHLASFNRPDIFIPHMGGVGTTGPLGQITMGADHVVAFAGHVGPKKNLACPSFYLHALSGANFQTCC